LAAAALAASADEAEVRQVLEQTAKHLEAELAPLQRTVGFQHMFAPPLIWMFTTQDDLWLVHQPADLQQVQLYWSPAKLPLDVRRHMTIPNYATPCPLEQRHPWLVDGIVYLLPPDPFAGDAATMPIFYYTQPTGWHTRPLAAISSRVSRRFVSVKLVQTEAEAAIEVRSGAETEPQRLLLPPTENGETYELMDWVQGPDGDTVSLVVTRAATAFAITAAPGAAPTVAWQADVPPLEVAGWEAMSRALTRAAITPDATTLAAWEHLTYRKEGEGEVHVRRLWRMTRRGLALVDFTVLSYGLPQDWARARLENGMVIEHWPTATDSPRALVTHDPLVCLLPDASAVIYTLQSGVWTARSV
jgi:hypothetical protein